MTGHKDRIDALEIRLTYLENFLDELNKVVLLQNKNLDTVKQEQRIIKEKLQNLGEQKSDPENQSPHYKNR